MEHRDDLPALAAMRRDYAAGGLREQDLAAGWLEQFERWLADAVAARLPEPNAMVLATADADGRPAARTVLLKHLDERGFVFNTNYRSRKGREVDANPRVALVFPWIELERQVVVDGTAARVEASEADEYFASRPRAAQVTAHASPQSEVVASREDLENRRAEAEARFPGDGPVPRPEQWGGLRVAPEAVEFWQGRADRLHDRLRYRRAAGGAWVIERLAP